MRTIEKNAKGQAVAPRSVPITKKEFEMQDNTRIYWLGGGAAMICSHGTNILIDPMLEGFDLPMLIENPLPIDEVGKVDGVCITHIDNDHFSKRTLHDIKDRTGTMIAPGYVADVMKEEQFPVQKKEIWEEFVIGDVKGHLTPARHNWQNGSSKYNFRHWEESDYCGYWFETKEGTIWMPGDSQLLDCHMTMPDPDVILFDFADNEWHITLDGAIRLANTYPNADLICIHWGSVDAPNMTPFNGNPETLLDRVVNPERIHVLGAGEAFVMKPKKERRKRLGNTELMVSDVCLGCMGFGEPDHGQHQWTLGYDQTKAILKAAWMAGINFFDTAPAYSDGDSEAFIGRFLKEEKIDRNDVVLATKFFPRTFDEIERGISMKEHIETNLNASLKRLQSEYVDLYILHMWDYNTPIEETLCALNDLVKAGKVRYIGISNAYAWQVAMANTIATERGWTPFASIQGHYNLIFREEEREMIDCAKFFGMGITPYSSLAAGRLARNKKVDTKRLELDGYARFKYGKTEQIDQVIIDREEEIANRLHVSMTAVALAWLIAKGCVPIAGATKPVQIDAMKEASKLYLDQETIDYLDELYVPHVLVGVMAQNKKGSSPFSNKKTDMKKLEKSKH